MLFSLLYLTKDLQKRSEILQYDSAEYPHYPKAYAEPGYWAATGVSSIIILLNIQKVIESIHWGVAPTWGNFLAGISIAMVTYTGIETISNLSEEAKDPGRNVPLATWWVIVAVLFQQ